MISSRTVPDRVSVVTEPSQAPPVRLLSRTARALGGPALLWVRATDQINRSPKLNGTPFDPATSIAPPHGRYGTVHYGVMIPGLPEPFRFLDVIAVLGTPPTRIFGNPGMVTTTPADTALLLTGIGGMTSGRFRGYSIAADCDFAPDGSSLRFGDDLTMQGRYPDFTIRRTHPEVGFALTVKATDKVSHFAHLPGAYDHWSVLCEYSATIEHAGSTTYAAGLCTYEYARAVNIALPMRFFTYQILNIDERTQVLMVELRGVFGVPLQRAVYVRSLDDYGAIYTRGYRHVVHEYAPEPLVTPDGVPMRMPKTFTWRVDDHDGQELIAIDGCTNDDFVYGLAAGYAGSYTYTGTYRGNPIGGTGYIEWIDR